MKGISLFVVYLFLLKIKLNMNIEQEKLKLKITVIETTLQQQALLEKKNDNMW